MARIALEARSLSTLGGGVRTYTKEVISRILKAESSDEYIIYHDSKKNLSSFPGAEEKVVSVGHPLFRIGWDYFLLPQALKRDKIDFIHYFKPATTPFKKPVAIATMYDVIPLLYPETQTAIQLAYWRKQLPLTAKTCAHLITISECSKRDIVRLLQVDPAKITVTPLGVDSKFKPVSEIEKIAMREKYRLPEKYILYLGTIEPRKNVARLIRAFNKVAGNIPHSLVLAGKWGWSYEDVKEEIAKSPFKDRIISLSYVESEYLPSLCSAASIFVFPSLYEGYGLPPLEAMACGTPVITSNVSSLPEVVGDAALTVDPLDEDALSKAIERLALDTALQNELSEKGLARAKQFNWDKTAEMTLGVYKKVFQL
ncbi:MAG: glycosyltransferase family 1 protein [bacterium]|nr:glycosyltransferase family 1 protein [bacterium]